MIQTSFLKELIQEPNYPSITVTFPTHRTAPGVSKDPIVLKNLRQQLEKRLFAEMDKRKAQEWLDRFDKLISILDHQDNLDGMGIFLGEKTAMIKRFPFTLPERVVVDRNFLTRDLLKAISKSLHYYVLSLSKEEVHLFEAYEGRIENGSHEEFPMENPRIAADALEKSFSDTEDRYTEEFFREVDEKLQKIHKGQPLPIVITGVRRVLDYYSKKSNLAEHIILRHEGAKSAEKASQWIREIWSETKEKLQGIREQRMNEIVEKSTPSNSTEILEEVWAYAKDGRVSHLLVNENFFQAARVQQGKLVLIDKPENAGDYDDIVDEIAELVLLKGGQLDFSATAKQPILAHLRY